MDQLRTQMVLTKLEKSTRIVNILQVHAFANVLTQDTNLNTIIQHDVCKNLMFVIRNVAALYLNIMKYKNVGWFLNITQFSAAAKLKRTTVCQKQNTAQKKFVIVIADMCLAHIRNVLPAIPIK